MRKIFYVWTTVSVILLFQGGIFAMQEKTTFYQLTYQTENVMGQITINGFVLTEIKEKSGNGTAALNPWLIGENELKAELKKADPSKPAEFTFGVSEMKRGDTVSTTDRGKLFSLELKDKDFRVNGKASAAKKFKSTLDFKKKAIGVRSCNPTIQKELLKIVVMQNLIPFRFFVFCFP